MGDPRRTRSKIQTPSHPWNKGRVEEEKQLLREYGLKNKKEIWKMNSVVDSMAKQAKHLIALRTSQAEIERKQLLQRAQRLGLIGQNSVLEDILDLKIKDVLERRLQTIIFRKNLARSMKQSRQFIVHGHVQINGKKLTVPSYIVPVKEENTLTFVDNSSLSDEEHPERKIEEKEEVKAEDEKESKEGEEK